MAGKSNSVQFVLSRRVFRNAVAGFIAYLGWTIAFGSGVAAQRQTLTPKAHGPIFDYNWILLIVGVMLLLTGFYIAPKRDVVHYRGLLRWRMTFKPDDPEGVRYWAAAAGFVAGLIVLNLIDPMLFRWCFDQLRAAANSLG